MRPAHDVCSGGSEKTIQKSSEHSGLGLSLSDRPPWWRPDLALTMPVGAAIAFLASERSGYTSGSVAVIDAGLSARAQSF